jgi:hypothetical protein
MVFIIRFAPGLRIALSAACAYADVPPAVTFSVVNMASQRRLGARTCSALVAWAGSDVSDFTRPVGLVDRPDSRRPW